MSDLISRADAIKAVLPLGKDSYTSIDTRHPLYRKEYEITYVVGSFRGLADGYVAFGITPINSGESDTE